MLHAVELLWFLCLKCDQHVAWRRARKDWLLLGQCCGLIYKAEPFSDGARYHLCVTKADLTNVRVLSTIA